jgi:DNA repair protein RadA/Sms
MMLREVSVPERLRRRLSVGRPELDRLLGGGIVPGSSILLTGAPGAGKSTWALQLADVLDSGGASVVYVCGEEAACMVRLHAERLGVHGRFDVTERVQIHEVVEHCRGKEIVIIDSLQSIRDGDLRGSALMRRILDVVRELGSKGTAVILLGQVTKRGAFAGPMAIRHDVDVHIHMEMTASGVRSMRIEKNRFGPTTREPLALEIGVRGLTMRTTQAAPPPRVRRRRPIRTSPDGVQWLRRLIGS